MPSESTAFAKSARKNYYPSIDGLRLMASVNVVLFHLVMSGALHNLQGAPGWLFVLLKGPAFNASLFFIVGGFIYGARFVGREQTFSAGAFLKKRLRALYPLHAVTTVMMVGILYLTLESLDIPRLLLSTLIHLSGTWALWPQQLYSLNTPSWALSAFFLCYISLGPSLKATALLITRKSLLLAMAGSLAVIAIWSGVFAFAGSPTLYPFFHVFAPVRYFEFLLGILLARFFMVNPHKSAVRPLVSDLFFIGVCFIIYLNAKIMDSASPQWRFFEYHTVMVPLYAVLVYRMARTSGLVGAFFALKPIRAIGTTSFYPYLLHVPLASLTNYIALKFFGVDNLFHRPLPLIIFIVCLYGTCSVAWNILRKGKGSKGAAPPGPEFIKGQRDA